MASLPPLHRCVGSEPTEAEPTEAEPTETEPTEAEPTEAKPTEAEPTEAEPTHSCQESPEHALLYTLVNTDTFSGH